MLLEENDSIKFPRNEGYEWKNRENKLATTTVSWRLYDN